MDVEQLLVLKSIPFIPRGGDFLIRCLNPDHDDKNPSMRIDRITGIFNCFSCGFKGGIFAFFGEKGNFLQIKKDLLKAKIHSKLAENIGLEIPKNAVPFDESWRGISVETFRKFEAFQHDDSEFIGRVVFPIRNIAGKITAFNGRALSLEKQPRYNVYPRKAKIPFFPAKPPHSGKVMLVEGIFDMLNLFDKGLKNVVCVSGTQLASREKLQILKIQGVNTIDIMFDPDDAGYKATEEVKKLCDSIEINTRVVDLKTSDPGELTASKVMRLKEQLYG